MRCTGCGMQIFQEKGGECPYCGVPILIFKSEYMQQPFVQTEDCGADVFETSINSILEISCIGKFKMQNGNPERWTGSGFVVTDDGYAVTNAHVAANSQDGSPVEKMIVSTCGQTIGAKVVALADKKAGKETGVDLALIKLDKMPFRCKALQIENYKMVRNGEQIYVIGNSLGQGTCITSGVVSDRDREGRLMYDCPTNPGNSGGPVINAKGKVIGVHFSGQRAPLQDITGRDVIASVKAQGMNYAIPSDVLLAFLKKTINYK